MQEGPPGQCPPLPVKMTGTFGKGLCHLMPRSPAAHTLGRAHGCSELEHGWCGVVWDGGFSYRAFQLVKGVQLHREWREPFADRAWIAHGTVLGLSSPVQRSCCQGGAEMAHGRTWVAW